jgi:hypothetical protein
MLCGAFDGKDAPPAVIIVTGWTLAGVIIAAGRKLKRRVSRTFCLVVAGIECMMMPFGTVLGVFTIVVLTKDSVREMFTANDASDGIYQPANGFPKPSM